jgi:hypothetical protein
MPTIDFESKCTEEVKKILTDQYEYHSWDEEKTIRGTNVRDALQAAVVVIINNVPPSPDRSVALRKIREARMDCNSAITHDGKY